MTTVDPISTIDEYLDRSDWRVNANANQDYSIGGLILNSAGKVTANYWLEAVFSDDASVAHRSGDIHIHDLDMLGGYCFTGDTRISLLDGTNPSFEELFAKGLTDNLELYAYDHELGDVVPAVGRDLRITRWEDEIAHVTIDNGEVVKCTLDHKWLLRDGTYREAKDLQVGDSLMPLYTGIIGSGYRSIRHNSTEGRTKSYVHRWHMEHLLGRKLRKDEVVHHLNGVKDDNRRENLQVMDDLKHRSMELKKTRATPKWQEQNARRLAEYNRSAEKRAQVSEFASKRERSSQGTFVNHKVVSVEIERLDEKVPMFDLEVPEHHNFALDAGVFVHNCAGWSLRGLLEEGFNGVEGTISAGPPKHFSSAVGQIVNFLGTMQNEWAGAQAFSSFDTYMAPFVRLDDLSYDEVRQNIQEMIFNLNVPSRWGSQAVFSNLTMDWVCPDDLKDTHPIIGGVEQDFTYGDLQDEMDVVNKAFMDVMIEGDANGRVFTFPIPTYNITKDFDWDSPNSDMLFEMTAKYGLPYFQNFVNSDLDPAMIRSMCPLTSDTEVIVRTEGRGVRKAPISNIVFGMEKGTKYEVWTPSGWKGAEPVRAEASEAYKFTLSNGLSVSMGENHLQPVRDRGTISARDIQVGDWLPYSRTGFHNADLGTYDLGYAVGAYMGDGSVHDSTLTYSLNETTKISLRDELVKFWESMGYKTRVYGSQLRVLGHAGDVVRRYVGGKTSLDKHLKDLVYDMGIPFREGLLQGWADTDGSQSRNRVYTASREAAGDMVTLAVTLGRKARLGDKDTRDGRLSTSAVYRVDLPERDNYGDVFQGDEEYHYYRVESIEPLGVKNNLYCFEVQDDDHLFTLADGLTTHNCRLQLDMTELLKRGNGLFGSAELTGSIGVVTVNMARLGYLYRGDWDALVQELDRLIDVASDTLEKRRDVVQENMDRGLYPFTKRYLGHLNNHFSTIGVNGINEMIRNYTGDVLDITDPEGHDMAAEILDHIRERMTELQEATGNMYNLEATPAEGTTYRFAKEDKELYPDIIQAGTEEQPYYTNSSQLPVGYTDDPFQALKEQDELQGKYTGGTVLHLYMGEKMSSTEATKQMVKRALTNHRLPYITVTPTFSICPVHGYLSGEHELCPKCDEPQECEVWTRVMGYFRPVASYNIGKKGEYAERVEFVEQV